jgi:hypothetical protein
MAHFAKVKDGIVEQVIVAEPDFFDTFVDTTAGEWIQTSYNTRGGVHYEPNSETPSADQSKALRYNYAGDGFHYDKIADAFYPPQIYPSWILNTNTYLWEPPVAYPSDGGLYVWNETTQSWDAVTE